MATSAAARYLDIKGNATILAASEVESRLLRSHRSAAAGRVIQAHEMVTMQNSEGIVLPEADDTALASRYEGGNRFVRWIGDGSIGSCAE